MAHAPAERGWRTGLRHKIAGEVVAKVLRDELVEAKRLREFFESRLRA